MTDGPAVTVTRAAELLHCCRRRVFQLLADGVLERAPKYGKETTITTASVYAALEAPPEPAPKPKPKPRRARRGRAHLAAEARAAFLGLGSSG